MSQGSSAKARRTAARLAAVQALYRLDMGDNASPRQAVYELMQMRQDDLPELLVEPDTELLDILTTGATTRLSEVDSLLDTALSGSSRNLGRTEPIMRAVLRAGAFELLDQGETPGPIIINDYVNVAKAFYTEGEHSKVNAVLDKVATALDRK